MRGHSSKSPKTFEIDFPLDSRGLGPFPWLPLAPTYYRRLEDGTHRLNVHRCPYCAGWHQHTVERGGEGTAHWIDAPCTSDLLDAGVVLAYRTIPIISPNEPPSTKELDQFFPLVDYATTEAKDACFAFERDDHGHAIKASRLHGDWLPGGPLHERWVFGARIDAQAFASESLGVRQPIPREVRSAVWRKTNGHCWYCGDQTNPFENFHVDHVHPVSDGGTNDLSNLVPSCQRCNNEKHVMPIETFRQRRGGGLFWFEIARGSRYD
jgi:hypothetical protein